jgi:hypothetical protein
MRCPRCHAPVEAAATRCLACGASLLGGDGGAAPTSGFQRWLAELQSPRELGLLGTAAGLGVLSHLPWLLLPCRLPLWMIPVCVLPCVLVALLRLGPGLGVVVGLLAYQVLAGPHLGWTTFNLFGWAGIAIASSVTASLGRERRGMGT